MKKKEKKLKSFYFEQISPYNLISIYLILQRNNNFSIYSSFTN